MIRQGDVYWLDLGEPRGSAPGYRRPMVVIQNDVFNRCGINTVVLCSITTNRALAQAPGNVLLNRGEGNLPRRSVVNVSQIVTADKSELVERIGSLSQQRIRDIIGGVGLLLEPQDVNR